VRLPNISAQGALSRPLPLPYLLHVRPGLLGGGVEEVVSWWSEPSINNGKSIPAILKLQPVARNNYLSKILLAQWFKLKATERRA
jgi:hypothetical protein